MEHSPDAAEPTPADAGCPRHPERGSHPCPRCGRPVCEACTRQTGSTVGCVDCLASVPDTTDTSHPAAPVRRPVVTYAVSAVCVVAYAAQWLYPPLTDLGDFSAIGGYLEPWRFLTAAFLHSTDTITHILFNLMGLYAMGQFLEPALGRARFTALYLLSALGGSVGYLLSVPHLDPTDQSTALPWVQMMLGSSGAVFGLFAAALLVLRRTGAPIAGMVVLIAINLAMPLFTPNVAWQAHLGGAVTGLVVTALLLLTATPARRRWTWVAMLGVLAALVVTAVGKYGANIDTLRLVGPVT